MSVDPVQELAELLQRLKGRTGRSYEALARRANLSRSSVHRYCSGAAVPTDFESLSRLGRACGATRDELLELHRRWALASAMPRDTPPGGMPVITVTLPDKEPGAGVSTLVVEMEAPAQAEPEAVVDSEAATPPRRRLPRKYLVATLALAIVGTASTAAVAAKHWTGEGGTRTVGATAPTDSRLLFTPACADPVSMGQQDECVREVQNLLLKAGTTIGVDASFGPQTLRKVTAFQVLAGLPTKGVVDNPTKEALYAGRTSMKTWTPEQVEKRVRQVFKEKENQNLAVRIARCQSYLDPHWVTPNTNGTRNWGVFQLADVALDRYQGTPLKAFDPEWNIQIARKLWAENKDFRHWPACLKAAQPA
ncbi:helix-turn-helix domain-containing protein [Actinoplanes sp. NPDC051859]|uniref:helix-turn-helix domain-containing protein n=1 Tax=Actinoplanes sp. NPDC051859 TaxID=3363909 RepID=UPI00379E16C0